MNTAGTEHGPLPLVLETVSCNSPEGPSPALTPLNSKTPWTGEDKKSLIYISFWEIHAALQEQNCSILASGSSEEKAKTSILAYLTGATNAEPVGLAAARSSQLLSGTFMTRLKLYRVTKVGNTRWDPQADKALLLSTASPHSRYFQQMWIRDSPPAIPKTWLLKKILILKDGKGYFSHCNYT